MAGKIEVFLDMKKMVEETADQSVQKTATFIRAFAKEIVRKRSWNLHNSIRANEIDEMEYEVVAGGPGVPYAAAQEYGRPDLANYGFTPYMRPAAAVSQNDPKTRENMLKAVKEAIRASKVRKVKRF